MKLNKKITMGALAAVAVVAPIATVVSCGSKTKTINKPWKSVQPKSTVQSKKSIVNTPKYLDKVKQTEGGVHFFPAGNKLETTKNIRRVPVDGIEYYLPSQAHFDEMKQKSKDSVSISAFGYVEYAKDVAKAIQVPFAIFDKPATKLTDILWNNSFGASLYKNKQGQYNIFSNYVPSYDKNKTLIGIKRIDDVSYSVPDGATLIGEQGNDIKPANVAWKKKIFINGQALADQDISKITLEKGDVVEIGAAFKDEKDWDPFTLGDGKGVLKTFFRLHSLQKYDETLKRMTDIIDPLAEMKPFFNTSVGKNGGKLKDVSDRHISSSKSWKEFEDLLKDKRLPKLKNNEKWTYEKIVYAASQKHYSKSQIKAFQDVKTSLDKIISNKSYLTSTKFLAEEKKKMDLINSGKSFAINVITPSEVYYAIFPANPLNWVENNSFYRKNKKVIDKSYDSIFNYLNNNIFNINMGIGNQFDLPYKLNDPSSQTTKTMMTSTVLLGGVSQPGKFLEDNSISKPMIYTTDISKVKSFNKTEINKFTNISDSANLESMEAGKIYEITYNHDIDMKSLKSPMWIHGVKA